MRPRRGPCGWIGATVVLLAVCGQLHAAGGNPADPVSGPSAAALKAEVTKLAAAGRLTAPLIKRYKDYVWQQTRENAGDAVPEAFWTWAGADPAVRDGLILALLPDGNPDIVKRLWELKQTFGDRTDEYAQLAIAFAVVYGRAGDKSPWMHIADYTKEYLRDDRKPPTMTESFRYYLDHARAMRFPLRKTPWPLLVYVADNEIPIEERLWAIRNYGRRPDKGMERISGDVPYRPDRRTDQWARGDLPPTLENLRDCGGVCAENSYFAGRVYKSLGIPAVVEVGVDFRHSCHAWVNWVGFKTKRYSTDGEGYLLSGIGTGMEGSDRELFVSSRTYSPILLKTVPCGDVGLIVAAVRHSYPRHIEAEIGCAIYETIEGDARTRTHLLEDSIARSPSCARAWRHLTQACLDGVLTEAQAEVLVEKMIATFPRAPALTFEVFETILTPRLAVTKDVPAERVRRNLRILDRALAFYDHNALNDPGIRIVLLKGDYLVRLGRTEEALAVYASGAERYVGPLNPHTRFIDLFDRAMALMKGPEDAGRRLVFADRVVKAAGPPPPAMFCGPGADAYKHLINTWIDELRTADKNKLADEWQKRLDKMAVE
ncbi:MAG TPA: hypothetical protein VMY39_04510 [Planctomycetota bacterium]|nr:hypothetical protein [Planctomycetota bacterium]HUV38848.1 hypothetical protein [Planctomycetota bacterium]